MPIIAGRASAAYGAGFAAITAAPYAGPFGAYDSLAAITLASSSSMITFDGIPDGYRHLQIRGSYFTGSSTNPTWRINNDITAASYEGHHLWGEGSSANSNAQSGTNVYWSYNPSASFPVSFVMDWLDYSSTTKNKTMRCVAGSDTNGGVVEVAMWSGLYESLNPITSITLNSGGTNFTQFSSFALYGVK